MLSVAYASKVLTDLKLKIKLFTIKLIRTSTCEVSARENGEIIS